MDLGRRFPDRQVGSNKEPFTCQLLVLGAPLDLSEASVTFSMIDAVTGTAKVSAAAAEGDADGNATYAPELTDVDTPGTYLCQFIATWQDGEVHRTEIISVRILPNAGAV